MFEDKQKQPTMQEPSPKDDEEIWNCTKYYRPFPGKSGQNIGNTPYIEVRDEHEGWIKQLYA